MKLRSKIVVLTVGLLCTVSSVYAVPLYYTFTGTVTSYEDEAGIIADNYDLSTVIGSSVEYVFLVDFDRPGEVTSWGGEFIVLADEVNEAGSWEYFYVEGVSGGNLEAKDGGYFGLPDHPWGQGDIRYGYNYTSFRDPYSFGSIASGNDNEFISVKGESNYVQDWVVGQAFLGTDYATDSLWNDSLLFSDLTLTSITPVPVPAAFWLFASALLGLRALRGRSLASGPGRGQVK